MMIWEWLDVDAKDVRAVRNHRKSTRGKIHCIIDCLKVALAAYLYWELM